MTERRYNDDEIARIFDHATARQIALQRASPQSGLTLSELQQIAADVGIEPDLVAHAAADMRHEAVQSLSNESAGGISLRVARTVELERELTEAEWEQLVATLRMTFNAHGRLQTDGRTRRWSNGNLQATLEPGEHGHRLRLSTMKGNARSLLGLGAATLSISAALFSVSLATPVDVLPIWVPVMGIVLGTGTIGGTLASLRDWSRRRAEQMKQIAERVADW